MSNALMLADPPLDRWLLQPQEQKVRGTNVEGKDVVFVLKSLMGVGGKGIVFRAVEQGRSNPVVLKFPNFDLTYIDPESTPAEALKRLESHFKKQEQEYEDDYIRSKSLLKGCRFAHETVNLIEYTYKFQDQRTPFRAAIPLRIGVQKLLGKDKWCPLDDFVLSELEESVLKYDRLPKLNIDEKIWIGVAVGIANAIKEVHDTRVVHGDIWSPNVFLSVRDNLVAFNGRHKLIDFGNAWSTEYVSAQLGGKRTDAYAPPEERRAILPKSEASDVFAFGVLLLWLLTGPNVGTNLNELTENRTSLLLAFIRRKAVDGQVREALKADKKRRTLSDEMVSNLANGFVEEQIEALEDLLPKENNLLRRLKQKRRKIAEDESLLREHLTKLLEMEYGKRPLNGQLPSVRSREDIRLWEKAQWLKRRMYRPCESMIYDPGEVSIEQAASQRKEVRTKILASAVGKKIYLTNPWIVDIISHCVSSDQARRPRMVDVLRNLRTYSSLSKQEDPVQTVSRHRFRLLDLNEPNLLSRHNVPKLGETANLVQQLDLKDSRDVLVEYMAVCLRSLSRGDIYAAVTTLDMWQSRALGHDGRFLTANLEALLKGASIRRVFIVSLAELGSRFLVRMLVALAKKINLEIEVNHGPDGDLATLISALENIGDVHFTTFTNSSCITEKRLAFECLLHHVRVALHDQLQTNIAPSTSDSSYDEDQLSFTNQYRTTARLRLKRVLEGYELFYKFGAVLRKDSPVTGFAIYSGQTLPRESAALRSKPISQNLEEGIPGLFLGLRIEASLPKATKLRSSCPRSIIKSHLVRWPETGLPRYVMMETEAKGRGRENPHNILELNRVRIYYSKLPVSPTVTAFQKWFYGLDRNEGPTENRRTLPIINLGCLITEIIEVLSDLGVKET